MPHTFKSLKKKVRIGISFAPYFRKNNEEIIFLNFWGYSTKLENLKRRVIETDVNSIARQFMGVFGNHQ